MSLKSLRRVTIVAPLAFLATVELLRALVLEPLWPGPLAGLIGAPVVLLGILIFSIWVFRRLQEQQQRILDQNRALAALNAAGLSLSADLTLESVLQRVTEEARTLSGARYAALGVLGEDGQLAQFVTSGLEPGAERLIQHRPHGLGLLAAVIEESRPLRLADLTADPRSSGFCNGHPPMKSFLGVPVLARGRAIGNLYLTDKRDLPEFSAQDEAAVSTLAAQAGIAIENARLYRRVQRLAAIEERERIGRELHDGVIQAIYGAGLMLDDAVHTIDEAPPAGQEKVRRAMAALDRTISDIRTYILGLTARSQSAELAEGLASLVEEYRGGSAAVELRVGDRLPGPLPEEVVHQLTQIAREALANAVQHASPAHIDLALRTDDAGLRLTIEDDGVGFDYDPAAVTQTPRGRGLESLRERARRLGGRLDIETAPGRGTRVQVLVALSRLQAQASEIRAAAPASPEQGSSAG